MKEEAELIKEYILEVAAATGLSVTKLSSEAGLAHTTLNKFLKDGAQHIPSTRTIHKLVQFSGMRPKHWGPVPYDRKLLAIIMKRGEERLKGKDAEGKITTILKTYEVIASDPDRKSNEIIDAQIDAGFKLLHNNVANR